MKILLGSYFCGESAFCPSHTRTYGESLMRRDHNPPVASNASRFKLSIEQIAEVDARLAVPMHFAADAEVEAFFNQLIGDDHGKDI
jgi:hypothetical protein